jgi:signal transduction histidine kinase
VEIVDNGTAPPNQARGTGVGIRGMRERAETTGGYLDAGPLPDGGFRVIATWPLASVVRGPADTPERPS